MFQEIKSKLMEILGVHDVAENSQKPMPKQESRMLLTDTAEVLDCAMSALDQRNELGLRL